MPTTIQIEQETADKLRALFPGMTYEAAITRLITAPRTSSTIVFKKTIAALEEESEEHRVPFDSIITEVTMHFPPGASALVDVRLLYFYGKEKNFVVPTLEGKYIALDDATPSFVVGFPVKKEGRLKIEFLNYDSGNEHTISVIVTLISTPVID